MKTIFRFSACLLVFVCKFSLVSMFLWLFISLTGCNLPVGSSDSIFNNQLTAMARTIPTAILNEALALPTTASVVPEPTQGYASADDGIVYTVMEGDTCIGIANQFQIDLAALLAVNNLTADCGIQPGSQLVLPAPGYSQPIDSENAVSEIIDEPEPSNGLPTAELDLLPEATQVPAQSISPTVIPSPTKEGARLSGDSGEAPPPSGGKGQPRLIDDFKESTGCPTGMRCVTHGSFAWPSNSATYCIAPDSGYIAGGKDIYGDSTDTINSWAANGARYWLLNLGFQLVLENSCTKETDIIIGWSIFGQENATSLGITFNDPFASDQQVILVFPYSPDGRYYDISGNLQFHWDPANPDGKGYDGSLIMAHEMGHAIGLGHDTDLSSLMHPYASPGTTFRLNFSLGTDVINQYKRKYSSYRPALGRSDAKVGITSEYLTSENGQRIIRQVPIPDGMGNRLGDVRAACTVVQYSPNGDEDFSFDCGYDLQTIAQGYVTFYLNPFYSKQSQVSVSAIVWDNLVFPITDWMHFTMSDDEIWVRTWNTPDPNFPPSYPLPYNHLMLLPENDYGEIRGVYLITVSQYYAEKSDSFGWEVKDNVNGWLTFSTSFGENRKNEYVSGDIFVLAHSGNDTSFVNPFNLNARVDRTYKTICGNFNDEMDTGLDIWQENSSAHSSLIFYSPDSRSDAFGASGLTKAVAGPDNTVGLGTHLVLFGDEGVSCVTFQNILFQIGP